MSVPPLAPTLTAHLFPPLGRELVGLLRSLPAADWERPTVCPAWQVRDIAAHLLDTALRRLSTGRDAHWPPAGPFRDDRELVAFLNRLNAEWVAAARRLSPRLLTELLEWVEPQLAELFAALDPMGEAPFPVSWAGESGSRHWFDVARELTERWHHQQQIRLAVGAPPLDDRETSEAVFDTFLRALPHRYRAVAAAGASLAITVGRFGYWLVRDGDAWALAKGAAAGGDAAIELPEEAAWLLLTKGLGGEEAKSRAVVRGDAALAAPFFSTLAVMA